jgi:translation initiation factor IF-1
LVVGKATVVEAEVIELMPNAVVRVKLDNTSLVLAHAAGAMKTNFVRVRPGDRVQVELSPYDHGRGRIVKLLRKD